MKIKHVLMYIIGVIMLPIIMSPANAGVTFSRDFAPQEGLTASLEKPYRDEVCLNGLWQFQPIPLPSNYSLVNGTPPLGIPDPAAWEKTLIRIPSPWNVNSFSESDGGDFKCFPSYPASWEKVDMGWLQKIFKVPASWKGKRILLHFEAIAGDAEIVVNGISTARQFDIFMPLTVDITPLVNWSGENTLEVGVRKPALFDIPGKMGRWTYPTGSFWGMHIAGIWQDVYLQAEPMVRVEDIFVKAQVDKDTLNFDLKLRNDTAKSVKVAVSGSISQWIPLAGKDVLSAPDPAWRLNGKPALTIPVKTIDLKSGTDISVELVSAVKGKLALWTPDSPRLYGAILDISADGKVIDRKYIRFGWRQFGIKGKFLMLNGKPIQAKGDAWHFMGVPQMTRRYAWSWFKAIKDANGNAVRPHAMPYPRFYLDVADEMGIMVLDETAIWASHCGFNYEEPVTWDRFRSHADALVMRDRNHPSVFGWSVENEVNAALGVTKVTPEEYKQIDDKIIEIAKQMGALDPTRPWISADGDEDMGGRLKAAVGHYGDLAYFERMSKLEIPYGIGEASCAYYATPKEASQFVGDRAYESMLGRMEGIAIDAYNLLANGQRKSAAYCSIFNLAWYGLKPQPIGLKDTSLAPKLTDGIFFGKYIDGKPGMQPERLGPYSTTFNPGYDPKLPLYETWPLFDAVKAAYAPKPLPSPWDHKRVDPPVGPTPAPTIDSIGFIGDPSGKLSFSLIRAGVVFEKDITRDTRMLVIDGNTISESDYKRAADLANTVTDNSGTVMVWGLNKKSLQAINKLLPMPVALTDRNAVSLSLKGKSPLSANMRMSDLYFVEQPFGAIVLPQGLGGPFVNNGHVILEACNTDWRRWIERGENIKTGSVLRSERERKPSGAALVEFSESQWRYLVCNIDLTASTPKHMELMRKLMTNLGVKLSEPVAMQGGVFDSSGSLKQALVIGSFAADTYKTAYGTDYLGGETSATMKPKSGDKIGDLAWQIRNVDDRILMDFKRMGMPGPSDNCAAYISFWVFSPRPLDQLLAQPDVPRVDLIAGADDGVKIWLNGSLLLEEFGYHPIIPDQHKCLAMPLKQGWNHFLIKVAQSSGEWQFAARLQCSDPRFLASMRSSADAPSE